MINEINKYDKYKNVIEHLCVLSELQIIIFMM